MSNDTTTTKVSRDDILNAVQGWIADRDDDRLIATLRAAHVGTVNAANQDMFRAVSAADPNALVAFVGVIDAYANSRTVSRVTRPTLSDDDANVVLSTILDRFDVNVAAGIEFGDDMRNAYADRIVAAMVAAAEKVRPSSRRTVAGELTDIADADDELVHGDHVATVNADGTIAYDGTVYKSVSAAAKAAAGHSVNGWTYWKLNGATLASLRNQDAQGS